MNRFLHWKTIAMTVFFLTAVAKDIPKDFVDLAMTSTTGPLCSLYTTDCPQTSFEFPNVQQVTNFIRFKSPIPDLGDFTVCFWINPYTSSNYDSWFSYANIHSSYQAFTIRMSTSGISLYVNGEHRYEDRPISANVEHHICFATFAATTGISYIFIDGKLNDIFNGYPIGVIKGGGVFMLGQYQSGTLGAGYSSTYSAQGVLSNFMIWNRVLPYDDYALMYQDRCSCASDYILSLENEYIQISGGVSALPPHVCPSNLEVEV